MKMSDILKEGWEADLAAKNRTRITAEKEAQKLHAKLARGTAISPAMKKPQFDYSSVMSDIDNAIGNAFPDGDPIDVLGTKYGMGTLDKAVRMLKAGSNYNDYVENVWQQHLADNPDLDSGQGNPWR